MLRGRTIILGVTGGIAAYKTANLASMLVKQHADVHVLMTENASRFIGAATFEALTGNKCLISVFDRGFSCDIEHVTLAGRADLALVAPASANTLAKLNAGIADDMLTSTLLACSNRCPRLLVPAMNTHMYENPVTQRNLKGLAQLGFTIIEPSTGRLACGDVGRGKMPTEEELLEYVLYELAYPKDMTGRRVLVTAGPTREAMDPVRFITNHSSGSMGYAIARAAMYRGADVTLVSGPVSVAPPPFVKVVSITSAAEMFEAVTSRAPERDIIIKAAAVADYRPTHVSVEKIKKSDGDMTLQLERNPDILKWLGENRREGQFLCGFAMETSDLERNARMKLEGKCADMIAANALNDNGAGFGAGTNVLTLITTEGEDALPLMSKDEAAHVLLDRILERIRAKEL